MRSIRSREYFLLKEINVNTIRKKLFLDNSKSEHSQIHMEVHTVIKCDNKESFKTKVFKD